MNVGIMSDSPTLTTGFGRTTTRIGHSLAATGYHVRCFGLKAGPGDVAGSGPLSVWPAERYGRHWSSELGPFLASATLQVLVLNMDAYNAVECIDAVRSCGWTGPIVSYVCFDGLPATDQQLAYQRSCAAVWATSEVGAHYLRTNGVEVDGVAPPGVDLEEFREPLDRDELRRRLGLEHAHVVGVFGTNTERKQLPRAIEGFAGAVRALPDRDLRMYIHAASTEAWDLLDLARRWSVDNRVSFAGGPTFDERRGAPIRRRTPPQGDAARAIRLQDLSYADRLASCDIVVNVSHSGDVEQVIIEAQACGVPVAGTDDGGVMSEALGDAGIPLRGAKSKSGRSGEELVYVDPTAITEAIVSTLTDDTLRARLQRAGLRNAARYPWSVLENSARSMVEPFATRPEQGSGAT